jgi:hypothetical protein
LAAGDRHLPKRGSHDDFTRTALSVAIATILAGGTGAVSAQESTSAGGMIALNESLVTAQLIDAGSVGGSVSFLDEEMLEEHSMPT